MADVVQNAQQEFWRPPSVLDPAEAVHPSSTALDIAEACSGCGSEFYDRGKVLSQLRAWPVGCLHGARCSQLRCRGDGRRVVPKCGMDGGCGSLAATAWRKIPFPAWLRYLHFHEIKRWVGLPTASLIAFIIGLGCVAGALGVSFFYKASNLAGIPGNPDVAHGMAHGRNSFVCGREFF